MSRKSSIGVIVCAAAVVLVAFAAFFALRERRPHESSASAAVAPVAGPSVVVVEPARLETIAGVSPGAAAGAKAAADDDRPRLDEAALMDTLRDLRGSNPTL